MGVIHDQSKGWYIGENQEPVESIFLEMYRYSCVNDYTVLLR